MAEHPWIKFYPRDWRGDQALRACSIAARGLWMEMLCIMHEASPYGHLVMGDRAVGNDVLARLAGISVDEVSELVSELEDAGVLSRSRRGIIYSRRLVKDRSRSEKGRKAVSKRYAESPEKKGEKDRPSRSPSSRPTTQKPEARYSVSNDTAGKPANLADRIWSDGLLVLTASGCPERQARSLLGRWRKDAADRLGKGDGDAKVLALLAEVQRQAVSEPIPWMTAALRNLAAGPPRFETREEREKRERWEWTQRVYGPGSPKAKRAAGER